MNRNVDRAIDSILVGLFWATRAYFHLAAIIIDVGFFEIIQTGFGADDGFWLLLGQRLIFVLLLDTVTSLALGL